jgi:hypothetical protein
VKVIEFPTQNGALADERKSLDVEGGVGGDAQVMLEAKIPEESISYKNKSYSFTEGSYHK